MLSHEQNWLCLVYDEHSVESSSDLWACTTMGCAWCSNSAVVHTMGKSGKKWLWTGLYFADISAMLINAYVAWQMSSDEHVLCHNHTTNDKNLPQCKFKFWIISLSRSLCSLHNHVCVCVCVCGVVHSSVIWMWIISFFVPRCWRLILFSAMANFMINIYFSWNELWLVAKHGVYTTWDKVLNNHNPTFYSLIEQCCGDQKKNINFFFLNSIHYRRINENAKKK